MLIQEAGVAHPSSEQWSGIIQLVLTSIGRVPVGGLAQIFIQALGTISIIKEVWPRVLCLAHSKAQERGKQAWQQVA